MKRILIINNNLHLGGVQKALVNLLGEIHGEYEITLLLFCPVGELLEQVPADVQVIAPCAGLRTWGMTKYDVSTAPEKLSRALWAGMTRLWGRKTAFRLASAGQKKLTGYDAVISYLHSGPDKMFYGGCNEFALSCVEGGRKLTFLHCDYERIRADSLNNRELYRGFDGIAACSAGCRSAFLRVMPELSKKTAVVSNCQNYAEIQRLAGAAPVQLPGGPLNLLTVARLGKEKGVLRAIRAVAALGASPEELQYTIIGSGVEYARARQLIGELHLEESVHLLGERSNPYGYMQAADVLLIPSVSEAAPMVIGEAACLGTPILTTETSSAREMVEETGYGWVCKNAEEGITQGLRRLLADPSAAEEKKKSLGASAFDNSRACRAFKRLVD